MCAHLSFNSALFSFVVFPFFYYSFLLFFSIFFSALFVLLFFFYCFQVYFKFSMQTVRHESETMPSLAVSVSESVSSASVLEPFETITTNG